MIKKYVFGTPLPTEAVIEDIPVTAGEIAYGKCDLVKKDDKYVFVKPIPAEWVIEDMPTATKLAYGNCDAANNDETEYVFQYTYTLTDGDLIYGLGGANRGINKRGYIYRSWNSDAADWTESSVCTYASQNFMVVYGEQTFGLYFDYPSGITFDLGFTQGNIVTVTADSADLALYVIDGDSPYDIVRQFRRIIGHSYLPPKFAFGFGQSRHGYITKEDFREVVDKHREAGVPLDNVFVDVEYMDKMKNFTINPDVYEDGFAAFVKEMWDRKIRLIPIIDAGVNVEKGYFVCDEGEEKGYFCRRADGTYFEANVGCYKYFPDVLDPEARLWFGKKYGILADMGVDGFWNDMNDPSIFNSREGMDMALGMLKKFSEHKNDGAHAMQYYRNQLGKLNRTPHDCKLFYHKMNGENVRHDKVHNLFAYYMTRGTDEGLQALYPNKRFFLISRSSFIGMHRYGGVWSGDNTSWWSHLLLNLKMLPGYDMCGFLFTGADLGGFDFAGTGDLLMRWLELGVFTPLMRNHKGGGERVQEFFRFNHDAEFASVIGVRYRILPYLYSAYMKAALNDDMLYRPLSFVYPGDTDALYVEDQVMMGDELMIAPVYEQNAIGRHVYLPEDMLFVKFLPDGTVTKELLPKGHHFVHIAINEVSMFIRKDRCIPLAKAGAQTYDAISYEDMDMIGFPGSSYDLYDDDGISRDCSGKTITHMEM